MKWPKALPNGWILGQVSGIATDADDHVWVLQRPGSLTDDERGATFRPPLGNCCAPASPVLEFDAAGNLLRSWGGLMDMSMDGSPIIDKTSIVNRTLNEFRLGTHVDFKATA